MKKQVSSKFQFIIFFLSQDPLFKNKIKFNKNNIRLGEKKDTYVFKKDRKGSLIRSTLAGQRTNALSKPIIRDPFGSIPSSMNGLFMADHPTRII